MEKKPLYQQIEEFLTKKIESGEWAVGSQILKERELCDMFDASRMTVSRALNALVLKGMIYRNAGKGSFVRMRYPEDKIQQLFGFSENMKSIGKESQSQVIEYGVVHANTLPNIQDVLELNDHDYMHRIVRLREANGEPIAVEIMFLSVNVIPYIDVRILEGSVYDYIENTLKLPIKYSNDRLCAVSSNPLVDATFKETITQPLLKKTSITFLENKQPFGISETYYLGNKYEYTVSTMR